MKYGFKGKGVLIHLISGAEGMPLPACSTPADADERKQVQSLPDGIEIKTGRPGRLAADKGHDPDELRKHLRIKGIQPQIPRKRNAGARQGKPVMMTAPRFQIERTFSWLQKKFRRLAVRWERLPDCFNSFLSLGIIVIWMQR